MLRTISQMANLIKFTTNKIKAGPTSQIPTNNQLKQVQRSKYGSIHTIAYQRSQLTRKHYKNFKQNLPAQQLSAQVQKYLCEVTLYMKHDQWKSQYIYAILNYQQLGFTRISDYIFLKQLSQALYIDKLPENQRWPVLKFKAPLQQSKYLIGTKQINNFMEDMQFTQFQIDNDVNLTPIIEKFVDESVMPHLEAIFWHPRLTFQQIFHTNISSYSRVNMNYKLIPIFYKNIFKVTTSILKNLYLIAKNRQTYTQSKKNLEKGLKQVILLLNNQQYFGGDRPNHLDFYLFAKLNTKISSKHFEAFLQEDIGGLFWDWFFRMRRVARHDSQRITLL